MRKTHTQKSVAKLGIFRASALCLLAAVALSSAAYALTMVWTRTVNGSADGDDRAGGVTLAPNSDIYAVGYKDVVGQNRNIWIRRYSPAGLTKWTRNVNGSASGDDHARSVAADSAGNLYIAGDIFSSTESSNAWVSKYNSAGARLWTRTFNGTADGADIAAAVAVDDAGNVFAVGYTSTATEQKDIWVRKYSSVGDKLWTRTVSGAESSYDAARGAAVDSAGNLYVAGTIHVTDEGNNIWVRKYDSSGGKLWTRTVNGPASGWDAAYGAVVDNADNLYVVGYIAVADESSNIWIRKYNPTGTKLWTRTYNGLANGNDRAHDAAVDEDDAVYVIGHQSLEDGSRTVWIRKHSPSGGKRWTTTYAGPDGGATGYEIAIDATKRIYAVGEVEMAGQGADIWVRKYRQ